MALTYSEGDLRVVGIIQERRNCTIDHAKSIYRGYVNKLANPDIPERSDLILETINRGVKLASDAEVEAAVSAPKKMTRFERKQAKKAAKAEKKPKKAPKATTPRVPRVEVALVPIEREVELTPVPELNHVYTANLFGRKHATTWTERCQNGAAARFTTINVSTKQMDAVKQYAKENDLPVALCVAVRVNAKLDQGYAVPYSVFDQYRQKSENLLMTLKGAARKAYAEEGWAGCKFSEKAAAEKAA